MTFEFRPAALVIQNHELIPADPVDIVAAKSLADDLTGRNQEFISGIMAQFIIGLF